MASHKLLSKGFFQVQIILLHFETMLHFLKNWGLWDVWWMRNTFIFDAQARVQTHIRLLKGRTFGVARLGDANLCFSPHLLKTIL